MRRGSAASALLHRAALPLGDTIATKRRKPGAPTAPTRDRLKPRLVKGLQITAVDEGYIVYDPSRERVHYLNQTAGLVMDLCTGKNSWNTIVGLVGKVFGLPRRPDRQVGDLLTELADEGLVSLDR
jgi:hypothetical protein